MPTTVKRADDLRVGEIVNMSWCLGVIREIRHDSGQAIGIVFDEVYLHGLAAGRGVKNDYYKSPAMRVAHHSDLFEVIT